REDLIREVSGFTATDKALRIEDENLTRRSMDTLAFNAADFGEGKSPAPDVMRLSRYLISEVGRQLGVVPASVFPFYRAMGRGELGKPMTVAAINVRGDAYNTARALFRAALANRVGAVILEIARSEIGYTGQSPAEYAAIMTAAAVREGFKGRLFLQGDHYQINAKKYGENPEGELKALQDLIRESLVAGFGQIDIDASTLERRGEKGISVEEAVRKNAELTADLTRFVRQLEADHTLPYTVSLGGESGEVGKTNTTVEEYRAYIAILNDRLTDMGIDRGISKISVNTGTAHGGVRLPDGTLAKVNISFDTLKEISREARADGLAGAVQHGASTLPDEVFHKFVEYDTAEVHLATGFQDIIMEAMPKDFLETLYDWVRKNCAGDRKPGQTEIQFLLTTRKKAWGPNKEMIWRMDEETRRRAAERLEAKFSFLFQQLNLVDTQELVERFVPEPEVTFRYP
ncbi:MAG: class II fructose-bisphosphate aldolase, partial [Deltaproteobacteria bacterium]|nr:class II fructose-bisphosphate aldolase [Deltaproteobacteria bacterium]